MTECLIMCSGMQCIFYEAMSVSKENALYIYAMYASAIVLIRGVMFDAYILLRVIT